MYQLAIFDLDGTLLDTIKDLGVACNVALEAYGYPQHDIEAYKYFVGNGIYKLVERALPEDQRGEETVTRVKATFDAYYEAHKADFTRPYEGIKEALERMQKKGVHLAVVTNKAHAFALQLIEEELPDLIEKVLGQREGIPTKPHPVGVLEMLAHFKVEATSCIYIGDSNVDIQTAQQAGVTSIGVVWGFRGESELREAGADYLVSQPKELVEIIVGQ